MRRKQWYLSVLLFCVSAGFLIYSSAFFAPPPAPLPASASLPPVPVDSTSVVVLANEDYYPYLKTYFRKAERKIEGTVYLFRATSYRDNEPADLLRELTAARKRNVEVNLVIDQSSENSRDSNEANLQAAETLRKSGVNVRFDTSGVVTHAKTFVIDDRYCFVGSHNMTHSAFATNAELSLLIDSPEVAGKITRFIRQIPLTYEPDTGKRK